VTAGIALTFDADMTPSMYARALDGESFYDARIPALLRAHRAPAAIFVTGLWALAHADILRALAADPLFEIGNHTLSHAAFRSPCHGLSIAGTDERKRFEIAEAGTIIHEIIGQPPRYFRFPGGCHDAADLRLVGELGYRAIGWDLSSGDAFATDAAAVSETVLSGARAGSVVVMHLGGANAPASADALDRILARLPAAGLAPVSLAELLAGRPPGDQLLPAL
jgi:peptidoglycan/xylan/chitin deacetylase (PgdA/CDA1 family)